MTPRQNDVYIAIELWWKKYGYSPSIDEVMVLTRSKSRGGVSRMINELCKMGALKRVPGKWRTVRPVYIKFRNMSEQD